MSLDFYLEAGTICSKCGHTENTRETIYERNITHNLGGMANAAGVYDALWRPQYITDPTKAAQVRKLEEDRQWNGARALKDTMRHPQAKELIPLLEKGLVWLQDNEAEARKYDAPNGWGMYEHFVPFVEEVLRACKENPDAFARASV